MGAPRLDALTSLRFLAAATIVAGHAGQSFIFSGWALPGIEFRQAVSFFYVLSGFILFFVYRDLPPRGRDVGRFLLARVARVWPAHILGLIAVLLLIPAMDVWGGPLPLIVNITMMHALVPVEFYALSYNDVSWSISDEAVFYLLFPVLLLAVRRSLTLSLLLAAGLVAFWIMLSAWLAPPVEGAIHLLSMASLIYLNPMCRMAEFLLGMMVGRLVTSRGVSRVSAPLLEGMSLLLCAAALIGCARPWVLGQAIDVWVHGSGPCIAFAVLIGCFAASEQSGRGVFTRLLAFPPLVYLGEISLSMYILHRIVLRFLDTHQGVLVKMHLPVNGSPTYGLYWLGLIAASALCHEAWEKPMRRLINGLPARFQRHPAEI